MRRLLFLFIAIALAMTASSQSKPVLKFNADGKFKIVQFTDIHYKYGKDASKRALECINAVLDAEKPDFVIITGDLVYADSVEAAVRELTAPIVSRSIPFGTVFGNHDHQFDRTLSQTYDQIQSMPHCVMPERLGSESPDYTVEIMSGSHPEKVAQVLYCMDSHSTSKIPGTGKYDWLKLPQTAWYVDQSNMYADENNGQKVPSLMFMHIPVPEYKEAADDKKNVLCGKKGEKVCSPEINSGMFAAILGQKDVYGILSGHDHDNDFVANYRGILLAYGRYSGGDTVYNHLKPNGARVIELTESLPYALKTWLRLSDGTVVDTLDFKR